MNAVNYGRYFSRAVYHSLSLFLRLCVRRTCMLYMGNIWHNDLLTFSLNANECMLRFCFAHALLRCVHHLVISCIYVQIVCAHRWCTQLKGKYMLACIHTLSQASIYLLYVLGTNTSAQICTFLASLCFSFSRSHYLFLFPALHSPRLSPTHEKQQQQQREKRNSAFVFVVPNVKSTQQAHIASQANTYGHSSHTQRYIDIYRDGGRQRQSETSSHWDCSQHTLTCTLPDWYESLCTITHTYASFRLDFLYGS